jgi:16S rRNA (guanine966-N2)-methyltransferase
VVAGTARGRRLVVPSGVEVRPTSDRVREATFNSLGSLGVLDGAIVLDLFAGSGALGIEALSRGAEHATFVDSSRAAVAAIEENLTTCGLGDRATVVRSAAAEHLRRAPGPYDLALLDPPYAFDDWQHLLTEVRAAVLVVESDREIDPPPQVEVRRVRRYGGTVVTIAADVDREGHPSRSSEDRS